LIADVLIADVPRERERPTRARRHGA